MSKDKFKVPVGEIGTGTIVNLWDIKASERDLGNIIVKEINDISVEVMLKTTTIGVTANFVVTFNATYDCVRCLEPFVKKTVSELLLIYSEGRDPLWAQDRIKLKAQDSERIYYTGPYMDIRSG